MRKKEQFSDFFKHAKKVQNNFLILYYVKQESHDASVAFINRKKEMKLAVKRNKLKRLLREYYRLNRNEIGSYDIVILSKKECYTLSTLDQITEQVDKLITKKELWKII